MVNLLEKAAGLVEELVVFGAAFSGARFEAVGAKGSGSAARQRRRNFHRVGATAGAGAEEEMAPILGGWRGFP